LTARRVVLLTLSFVDQLDRLVFTTFDCAIIQSAVIESRGSRDTMLPIFFVHRPLVLHEADLSLYKGIVISKEEQKAPQVTMAINRNPIGASTK
jgi:hypothetical protein